MHGDQERYGGHSRVLSQYRHICEVPADLLSQWLAQFCFICGESIERLEEQWRVMNQEWADEAAPDVLQHWSERLGIDFDAVKEQIANGLLCDTPPMYTIGPTMHTALDVEADCKYHICGNCFGELFQDVFEGSQARVKDVKTHTLLLAIVKSLKIEMV